MHFDVHKLRASKWARSIAVFAGALALALLVVIALHRSEPPLKNPLPQPAGGPGAIVPRPAETGELWRQPVFAQDGVTVVELRVAYVDGRLGTFFFDHAGNLARFVCDFPAGEDRARYQATFTQDGKVIAFSVTKRADGSIISTYRLNANGVEEAHHYRNDGTLRSVEVTYADGSRRTASMSDDGKEESSVTFIGPSLSTVKVPDSTEDAPAAHFEVKLAGVRATGWDYVDSSGRLVHTALYLPNGDLQFTFFDENGTVTHRQIWRLTGRDWQRGYYTLARVIELYQDEGTVYRDLELYPDQKTVRMSRLYRRDGTLDEVRHYDSQGKGLKTDNFDWEGKYTYTSYPSWWSWSELVDESLIADPRAALPVELGYRLGGERFADVELRHEVEQDPTLIVRKTP